jgi:hypothetical protein
MLIVARILAVLSIASTAACAIILVGAARLNLVHLGFEFVGVIGGWSFATSVLTGALALLTIVMRVLLGRAKSGNAWVVRTSVISLLLLGAVYVFAFLV